MKRWNEWHSLFILWESLKLDVKNNVLKHCIFCIIHVTGHLVYEMILDFKKNNNKWIVCRQYQRAIRVRNCSEPLLNPIINNTHTFSLTNLWIKFYFKRKTFVLYKSTDFFPWLRAHFHPFWMKEKRLIEQSRINKSWV